jgi:DNA-binding response OmpR family regulator
MSNLSILYAEDEAFIRDIFSSLLKDRFKHVYLAENGKEAYELYKNKQPDILLLDHIMPFMNGLDVARLVRKENDTIPIIVLTAHSEREQLLQAVNLKLETYLTKPVDPTTLIETLQKVADKLEASGVIDLHPGLKWDNNSHTLMYEDKFIKLTKKEKQAIETLIANLNRYVRNEELIYGIWDDEIPDESHDNKLIQLIYRINKKITNETGLQEKFIENSYTLGYRILSK